MTDDYTKACDKSQAGLTDRMVNSCLSAMDQARPLCPDHRDKQRGKLCLACRIEELERMVDRNRDGAADRARRIRQLEKALAFYADRNNWRSGSDSLQLTLLDPEHVSSDQTRNEISGLTYGGWEVAEHALKGASE